MPSSGSSSVTAGVNLGTDTSASIQFSMSANWSELKFTSKTSAATGVYGATWCDGSRSDYTQYSSEYLGAFIFQYKGDSGVYLYMDAKYYGTYSGVISKDSKGMVLKKRAYPYAFSLLSSCGEVAEPTRQTKFLLSKEAMIYSYCCDAPMLEKWSVGERIESIEEIPTVENSKTVACVAINGDETPSSSLNPKFIQEIYNRISKGNSARFLYHFVDVSFLKGTPFRYYFGKTGEYRAAYSEPVHFYNYGATKGYHYAFLAAPKETRPTQNAKMR